MLADVPARAAGVVRDDRAVVVDELRQLPGHAERVDRRRGRREHRTGERPPLVLQRLDALLHPRALLEALFRERTRTVEQLREHGLRVAEHRDIRGIEVIERAGVRVDLHELRGRRRPLHGVALEPTADGDDEVRLGREFLRLQGAVRRAREAADAERQRVRLGEHALRVQRGRDRQREQLRELAELRRRARAARARADVEVRALRGRDQGERALDVARVRCRAVARHARVRRRSPLEAREIARDPDHHGTGACGAQLREGVAHDHVDLTRIDELRGPLRDRAVHVDHRQLLGEALPEDLEAVLDRREEEDGHRVAPGVEDPDHRVRGARAGVREHDARVAGHSREAVARVDRDTLLPAVEGGASGDRVERTDDVGRRPAHDAGDEPQSLDAADLADLLRDVHTATSGTSATTSSESRRSPRTAHP